MLSKTIQAASGISAIFMWPHSSYIEQIVTKESKTTFHLLYNGQTLLEVLKKPKNLQFFASDGVCKKFKVTRGSLASCCERKLQENIWENEDTKEKQRRRAKKRDIRQCKEEKERRNEKVKKGEKKREGLKWKKGKGECEKRNNGRGPHYEREEAKQTELLELQEVEERRKRNDDGSEKQKIEMKEWR